MAPPRKYSGPCPDHPEARPYKCHHCRAYMAQTRYHDGTPPEPRKDHEALVWRPWSYFGTEIFQGLHWPAPERL